MKRSTAVLPVLIALFYAAGCATDRCAELFKLHVDWRGGRANLENLRDISSTGRLSVAGLDGPLTLVQQKDGYRKVEYDLKAVSGREFVTPEGGWEVNESGQLDAMDRTKLKQERRHIAEAFEPRLLEGEPVYIGTEERDGQTWEVLRFLDDQDYVDFFIDPSDGAMTWARSVKDGRTSWDRFENWRTVDGVRIPFKTVSTPPAPAPATTVTWNDVRINTGLTPADFDCRDIGRKVVSFVGDDEWIPLTLYRDRYIYVPCVVNGVKTEALLDSGAGITVLDKSLADQLGLVEKSAVTARGVQGKQQAGLTDGVDISIGSVKLENLTVAIIDLDDLTKHFARSMPVIMGKELFNRAIVDVDYPNERLALHDVESFDYQETGHSLEMHPTRNGKRLVELRIEDNSPALFQIDTGGGNIDIFDAYTREHRLLEGRKRVSTCYGGGVGGMAESKAATLDSIEFAGYRIPHVPAAFSPPGEGGFGTADYAGNLGGAILTRFRIIFDFTRNRLHVEPGPDWQTRPFKINRLGISSDYVDGHIVVQHVALGSPADKAGVKPNDVLEAVDGLTLNEDNWSTTVTDASRRPAGEKTIIRLADGRELTITLRDYY